MNNTLFERNMKLLETHVSRRSLEALATVEPSNDPYAIGHTPEGTAIAAFGENQALWSAKDPDGDAAKIMCEWWSQHKIQPTHTLVCEGFFDGRHCREMCWLGDHRTLVICCEPYAGAMRNNLYYINLEWLKNIKGEIKFCIGGTIQDLQAEVSYILQQRGLLEITLFIPPRAVAAVQNKYKALRQALVARGKTELVSRNTSKRYAADWLRNCIHNIPMIVQNQTIAALHDAAAGKKVMGIAAGPSLDETVMIAKKAQERAVIIAVNTAYRALHQAGVRPDIVLAIDAKKHLIEHFRGLPCDCNCVCTSNVYPSVMQWFPYIYLFQSGSAKEFEAWLGNNGHKLPALASGGTVAIAMLTLAHWLGCSEIYTLGLDLCFCENGRTHAENTIHGGNIQEGRLIRIHGNVETEVPTNDVFQTFADQLNAVAAKLTAAGVDIYNINPGGAKIDAMTHVLPTNIDVTKWEKINKLKIAKKSNPQVVYSIAKGLDSTAEALAIDKRRAVKAKNQMADTEKPRDIKKALKLGERLATNDQAAPFENGACKRATLLMREAFDQARNGEQSAVAEYQQKMIGYFSAVASAAGWLKDEIQQVKQEMTQYVGISSGTRD